MNPEIAEVFRGDESYRCVILLRPASRDMDLLTGIYSPLELAERFSFYPKHKDLSQSVRVLVLFRQKLGDIKAQMATWCSHCEKLMTKLEEDKYPGGGEACRYKHRLHRHRVTSRLRLEIDWKNETQDLPLQLIHICILVLSLSGHLSLHQIPKTEMDALN